MGINIQQFNKRDPIIKILIIIFVVCVFVFSPILSAADTIPPSNSDNYHGHLYITAQQNISLPLTNNEINTQKIVEAADPAAIQKGTVGTFLRDASYFISDEDLEKLNGVTNTSESVIITMYGQYLYYCNNNTCKKDYSIMGTLEIKVSFTPNDSYSVIFDGNGGKVDGKTKKNVSLTVDDKNGVSVGHSNMPKKVTKDGFAFTGWSTSQKKYKSFSEDTNITKDMTVYAHWKPIDDKKTISDKKTVDHKKYEKKPEKPKKISEKELPTYTRLTLNKKSDHLKESAYQDGHELMDSINRNDKSSYTKAAFISLAQEQNIPVAGIGDGAVPLYAPEGTSGWAFINLLLAVMGALMALICAGISIRQGRDKKSIWFVLSAIAGICGIVFFFVSEDLGQNMVLADGWTVISSLFLILSVVSVIIYLRKKGNIEDFVYDY